MNGRLLSAIEIVIFSLAVTALFGIVALLAKLIFKQSIGTSKNYSRAAIAGALIYVAIISVLPKTSHTDASVRSEPVVNTGTGLDAPFIAPPKEKMESFIPQLSNAVMQLTPSDKAQLDDAMRFLSFASSDYIKTNEPARFAKWDEKDAVAHSINKMYNFAVEQGNAMTLRKYIALADEFKKQEPELYQRFASSK
jgi:hypothetical protein